MRPGWTLQISFAYCSIVRSVLNFPLAAMLYRLIFSHLSWSCFNKKLFAVTSMPWFYLICFRHQILAFDVVSIVGTNIEAVMAAQAVGQVLECIRLIGREEATLDLLNNLLQFRVLLNVLPGIVTGNVEIL